MSLSESSISGKEASDELKDMTVSEREKRVLEMLKNGDIPEFITSHSLWNEVVVNKNGHTLKYKVAPYFAVGSDDDPLDIPLRPVTLQTVADYLDAIIPSRLMVTQIQDQAKVKIPFQDVKGLPYKLPISKIETWDAIQAANNMTNAALDKTISKREDGAIGYKKSVVTGPSLDGSRVAIFGARGGPYNGSIQPYSTIHESNYVDYSHGGVLVSRKAELDGETVDLRNDVFGSKEPSIYGLVSDQGRFDPVFPNSGSGSLAQFSTGNISSSNQNSSSNNSSNSNNESTIADNLSSSSLKDKLKTGGIIASVVALTWWIFS